MKRRGLNEEEERLWSAVTKDITKLDIQSRALKIPFVKLKPLPLKPSQNYDIKDFNFGVKAQKLQNKPIVQNAPLDLKNKDHNWLKKIRSKKYRPEGKIDLHGMTQDQAYRALHHYIDGAIARNKRLILVVTGKGGIKNGGILRTQVPRWLTFGDLSHKIISYYTAASDAGGEGALYVVLKK